jgi:hypothetical protein
MSEGSLITMKDLESVPPDAKKKWLQALLQEKKSALFKLKQQLDACEQEIEDIREGRINKVKYSIIVTMEQVKKIQEELNIVDLT